MADSIWDESDNWALNDSNRLATKLPGLGSVSGKIAICTACMGKAAERDTDVAELLKRLSRPVFFGLSSCLRISKSWKMVALPQRAMCTRILSLPVKNLTAPPASLSTKFSIEYLVLPQKRSSLGCGLIAYSYNLQKAGCCIKNYYPYPITPGQPDKYICLFFILGWIVNFENSRKKKCRSL
jgi:hypothetical protein